VLSTSTTGQACSGSTTTTTTTSTLSGGEADLRNFDLQAGDDLSQGDTNKEIAVAKFDVRGGDVAVQRVTVAMQPTTSSNGVNQHPWSFIQTLSVYNGNTKVGSVDVSSKSDWDQENAGSNADFSTGLDYYSVDVPVNTVIKEGDNNELSIRADAQNTIDTSDTAQSFNLVVPTNGIRAVDAKGIQEYTGSNGDSVILAFNTAQNGKLNITTASDNPNAGVLVADDTNTSDDFNVLAFNIKNSQDTDVDFNTITLDATSTGYGSTGHTVSNLVRKVTLDLDGDTYTGTISSTNGVATINFKNLNTTLKGNDTIEGTVSIELYGQTGHFNATGEGLVFGLRSVNVDAENSDTGDTSTVNGSATGKTQTVGVNGGITVQGNSNTTSESYNTNIPSQSTGNFTLKFDVTANGDNDIYVPKSVVATASTTAESTNANAGVIVFTDLAGAYSATTSASLTSTADTDSDNSAYYVVHAGDTETFTVNTTIDPATSGYYQVGLDMIRFTTVSTGGSLQNLDVDQTNSNFQTAQQYIH